MPPLSARTLAPALLLAGLLSGCAGHGGEVDTRPAAPPARPGTVLTAEEIERTGNSDRPIEKTLAARFPGVVVSESAQGGITIRIRGISSFYASNEPLYVVDGTPISPGAGGSLALNAHDISTIEVLKDPSQTALYGMRGSNGVIVITTKRGGR
ncbi:MAG TPA: TonB-dependent receptor plug domain-containing protein [Gemmatimonadaceae bacterium]|nr:TonB-dependent receptor plug domain-containing protein [Gemmatimonadaceae bacterium]